MVRHCWYKIYCSERNENRIFYLSVPDGNDADVFEPLRRDVRRVFNLGDDYDFYFTYTDYENDEITIKENHELLNYMLRMEHIDKLKLTIRPYSQQQSTKQEEKQPQMKKSMSDDTSSVVSLAESFQSIMKQFEVGISTLQATVEKNSASVATVDTVVKAAAETAAQVYRSMLPSHTATLSEVPQFDVICDGCYTPIRGSRYRCETCDDFDLCSTCKARIQHNETHNFRFIKNEVVIPPSPALQASESSSSRGTSSSSYPSQTIFICDFCDSDIVGIRHTCGACPDFDLCHSCFSIVKENHPQHIFVTHLVGTQTYKGGKKQTKKSKKQQKVSTSPRSSDNKSIVYHRGVECDNCDANITGIRYKCGHCANYDLCSICEEYATSIHDATHSFIKIRYPIQSIIKKPMLPKFTPLKEQPKYTTKECPTTVPSETREMEKVHAVAPSSIEIISKPEEIITTVSSSSTSSAKPAPIIVNKPTPTTENNNTTESKLSAAFISDINIPDGTLIVPKKTFIKMWKIVNNGNMNWPIGTHLLFNGGSILRPYPISRPDSFVIPVVSPREETVITAELQAPDCPGEYTSYFCLCTPDGVRFGDSLWCTIKVDEDCEPEQQEETSTSPNAADMMMNSCNSMIYPTVVASHHDEQAQFHDQYTDHDDYSEIKSGHVSSLTSEMTHSSFTMSQLGSPSASEMGSRRSYFPEDTEEEEDNNSFFNHAYQVISPSISQTISVTTTANPFEDEQQQEEEYVIVDAQQQQQQEESSNNDDLVTAASSMHSTTTVTSATVDEGYIYRSQLMQLHEMGFTSYDDLAITLLNSHEGRVEDVLAKLLEYA